MPAPRCVLQEGNRQAAEPVTGVAAFKVAHAQASVHRKKAQKGAGRGLALCPPGRWPALEGERNKHGALMDFIDFFKAPSENL